MQNNTVHGRVRRNNAAHKKGGVVFVLSGPSGSGKTTLARAVLTDVSLKRKLVRSVSFTTRPQRTGEHAGKDYLFVSRGEFLRQRKAKKILEWTRYLGYYYGTAKAFVDKQLAKSKSLILCLDTAGARRIRELYPENSITIFVKPPSFEELYHRIAKRRRETKAEIRRRLAIAKKELTASKEYDYCLVNKDLPRAVGVLKRIIHAAIG